MADTPDMIDADAQVVSGNAPPSKRVPLSSERIVIAAVEFIDEHGPAA